MRYVMANDVYIQASAVICGLGADPAAVETALFAAEAPRLGRMELADGRYMPVSAVELPHSVNLRANGMPETRNNRLAQTAYDHLSPEAHRLIADTPPARLGVVIGTSTAGVDEGGDAFKERRLIGQWPDGFDLSAQELGDPALYLAALTGATGPTYAISTACTSGAKAIIAAARLITQGVCDVVLCGGVDTLCDMTLNGFGVLEALSPHRCNPFSVNRSGIHIGEAGALFVLSAAPSDMRVAGWGESSDAHHISAPDPAGAGAVMAMEGALRMTGLTPEDIGYINLHGTATRQNDRMEAHAVSSVFGALTPCSSTKPLTGHTLGAAGAVEAAFLSMALRRRRAPRNRNDGAPDPELPAINLLRVDGEIGSRYGMSCNYAFGGNNTALILEHCDD